MENIKLNKVILHIIDVNHIAPILSIKELDIENEVADFLQKHIIRVLNDGDIKKANFYSHDDKIYRICSELSQNEQLFLSLSKDLTYNLFNIMKENPDIPSADIIFCLFEIYGIKHLAILKLNYKSSYIHYVLNSNEGNVNQLIKQKTTLPNETQKIDEAIIINLTNFDIGLIEKKYEICGEKEFYLSKHFLKCNSDLSNLQKIKILDKTVTKMSKKHFYEDFGKVTALRTSLAGSIEESNKIKVNEIAERVFGANTVIKNEYIEEIKKAGLDDEVINIPEENQSSKKFKTQRLKTDSGIEINFPSQYYNNNDLIEFINNPDGSISILIKNINKISNK